MKPTRADMTAHTRKQPLDRVLAAYDQIMRAHANGATLNEMDLIVKEQAPAMTAEAARRTTTIELTKWLADLEKARLDNGDHLDPSWAVQAQALTEEAMKRHDHVEQAIKTWEHDPELSGPLHAAANALYNLNS